MLIEELSVYDNLYYASKLCCGHLSEEKINTRVHQTLTKLGLDEIKSLKVGSLMDKIISGGQRKRINIALEVIREPSILFIDEPTSGLSSRDSELIITLLKELTFKGTLIFTVIHQPSSDIFKMFDRLLILDTGGYTIYHGNPMQAIVYFKDIVDRIDKDRSQCIECGNVNAEQIFSIIETKVINEYGKETEKRKILPKTWHTYFKKEINKEHKTLPQPSAHEVLKKKLHIANPIQQLIIFTQRDILSKLSNRQYLLINLLEPIVLASILAYISRYSSETNYSFNANDNIPSYFFMSIIVALFMGLTISAEELFKDQKILKRESFLNLSRLSYLLSKISILFTLSAIQTLSYVIIGDLILDIQAMTIPYWMVLFSVSCFANILGLNISSAFNSIATIYITIPLLIIPQIILSGSIISFDQLNSHLASKKYVPWVGEIMASRWAFEALAVTQFKDNPYSSQTYNFDRSIYTAEYYMIYWEPEIKKYLSEATDALKTDNIPKATHTLKVLQNEVKKQMTIYGADSFTPGWQTVNPEQFYSIDDQIIELINTIKNIHAQRRAEATQKKEEFLAVQENTSTKEHLLEQQKEYTNHRLSQVVKLLNSPTYIAEEDESLVQMIYTIYTDPTPEHFFDFRTRLFYPTKHFAGYYFSTLYFNVGIIWLMSILLFIAVYFNIFKKIIR